jgi:hypothetical protein
MCYFLVCLSSHWRSLCLQLSLLSQVDDSLFPHLTLQMSRYFLTSVRAYCVAGPFEISTIPLRGGRVQLKFQLYPYRIDSLPPSPLSLSVWYSVTFCMCVNPFMSELLILKNKQFHSNRSFGYWHGTCFNIKYCPIRLFFRFFQLFEECSTCPVQTSVGEGEWVFVGRIGENVTLFVFSFQIVCIPNSEFVIVQPSRHFLREQQYGGSSRFISDRYRGYIGNYNTTYVELTFRVESCISFCLALFCIVWTSDLVLIYHYPYQLLLSTPLSIFIRFHCSPMA